MFAQQGKTGRFGVVQANTIEALSNTMAAIAFVSKTRTMRITVAINTGKFIGAKFSFWMTFRTIPFFIQRTMQPRERKMRMTVVVKRIRTCSTAFAVVLAG